MLGLFASIAVLGLWHQLRVEEQLHIQKLVRREAEALEVELNRELSTRILALERMANRWQAAGGTAETLWRADATNSVKSFGYQAIEWVDPSFQVRWVVPRQGNEVAQNLDLSREPRRQLTLSIARDLNQTLLSRTLSLAQGGKGFFAAVPLYLKVEGNGTVSDRFDGFLIGVFRIQTLFDSILPVSPRYRVQIYDRGQLIYSQGKPSTAMQPQMGVVQSYGADWQIQVFPTPQLLGEERSLLPAVVLGGGLTGAWVLALLVYLGQRSARQTQRVREINQHLQVEIAQRQQIEIELRQSEAFNRNLSERLELAVQSAQIGIWDWDIVNKRLIWSERMYQLYGVEPDTCSGNYQVWEKSWHPDDVEKVTAALELALHGEKLFDPEFRVVHPDGQIRFIKAHAIVQRDPQSKPLRMIGVNFDITERKQAEMARTASQQQYQNLVENSPDIIERFDLQLRHLYVSPILAKITGLTPEVFSGKTCRELGMDEAMVNTWESAAAKLLRTGQKQVIEFEVLTLEGSRSFEMAIAPELSTEGMIESILCISRDITERKQTEAALRQSEESLRHINLVMQNAVEGFSQLDRTGHYVSVNRAYAQTCGYEPDELIGQVWTITVYPEDLPQLEAAYQTMLETGKVEVEARGMRKDGSLFYKQVTMIADYDDRGNLLGHHCFMKDISDRKAIENQLRQLNLELEERVQERTAALMQSETMFRQLSEHINEVFFVTSADLEQILYISPAYETVWGRTCESLYRQPQSWLDSIHPEDRDRILANLGKSTAGGSFSEEYRIIRPNGALRWIYERTSPIFNPTSQLIRHVGIAEDITERKQAEISLQASLQEKVLLLREIHHRVKNNLQIVSSLLELQAGKTSDPYACSVLQESQERIYAIALVHEHLYKSPNLSQVNFSNYAQSLVEQVFFTWGRPNLKLHLALEPMIINLETAFPSGLLLNELVSNALKHAFPDQQAGDIWVEFKQVGEGFSLVVKDNGVGFPAHLDFRQTESLGLQLVSDLSEQLNGTLSLTNLEEHRGLRRGTCFQLQFHELIYSKRL